MANHGEFERYKEILGDNGPSECQACGGPLTLEKVNLEDYQGGKLYMMEQVPAYVCENCGEIWVPEPIMIEFERMIQTVKNRRTAKGTRKSKTLTKKSTVQKSSKRRPKKK
ncbi:MAG: YgiT-type zinc finger protein [Candidatus Saganbacteria bacterium]|nr:YgiT-type zinc finger protein [Candidatus Saganbacteria bacterium]